MIKEKFENIIEECLNKIFIDRIKLYGYFDAEEYVKLEKEKLKSEIFLITDEYKKRKYLNSIIIYLKIMIIV